MLDTPWNPLGAEVFSATKMISWLETGWALADADSVIPANSVPSILLQSALISNRCSFLEVEILPDEGVTLTHVTLVVTFHVKELGPPALISIHRLWTGLNGSRLGRVGGGQLKPAAQFWTLSPGLLFFNYTLQLGE